jgi:hypothetical protein
MKDKVKAIAQQLLAMCDDCEESGEYEEAEESDEGGAQVTDMSDTLKQDMSGGASKGGEKKARTMKMMSAMLAGKLKNKK